MCSAVGLLRSGVGSSFIVEASSPDADRKALLRRLLRMLAAVTAVAATGLAIGGPVVLYVISSDYFHAATTLVLVMALESIVGTIVMVYFLLAQILRRLRLMLAVQCVIVVTTVSLALVLIPRLGLIGAGLATLSAQLVAVAVIAVPLRRAIVDFSATPAVPKSDLPDSDMLDSART
jgi:O-antigen/teichoic acid export membrane protein